MAFVPLYGFETGITAATAANAGLIQVDPGVATALAAQLGSSGTSYAALSDGLNYEIVLITAVNSPNISVTRAQGGTLSSAFPIGTCMRFVWTAEGITAIRAAATFTVTGAGAAVVTNPSLNNYVVTVAIPTLTADTPLEVLGAYPAWEMEFNNPNTGCCGGSGGGGGSTTVTGTGLVGVTGDPTAGYVVNVPVPNFIGAGDTTVTGTWPNITITSTGGGGGGGVTTITGSTKIVIAGSSSNPVINFASSGSGAGTYNGITYDIYGTITSVNGSYIPLTNLTTASPGVTIATVSPGVDSITVGTASTATQGLIKLALPTNAASNNAADPNSAVTPAGIAAVVAALPSTSAGGQNQSTYTAAVASGYTVNLTPSVTVALASGQTALIRANASVSDSAAPAAPPIWGIAVFNGVSLVQGISSICAGTHVLEFAITGPMTATLSLKSTALNGTTTVYAQSLSAITFP